MNIAHVLKSLIPMELLMKIKYHKEFSNPKELSVSKNKRIYFLDAPDYGNIGDQAIAYALTKFAEKYFPEYEFIEILQKDVASYIEWLKKNIQIWDLIFLTGGGNMGNVYRIYEATRRIIINSFPNNVIVIFPQSIMYTKDVFGRLSKKYSGKVYNRNKNVVVSAREMFSYSEMQEIMDNVVMCPDIVLSLSLDDSLINQNKSGIGICLRNDAEQLLSRDDNKTILKICRQYTDEIKEISTVGDYETITSANREKVVLETIKKFASCKIIVTDRLHAMIFSVITNTPCIVFQNSNKKVLGTVKWLENRKNLLLLNNAIEVDEALSKLNVAYSEELVLDYSSLIEKIRIEING